MPNIQEGKIKLNTEQRNCTKKAGAISKHLATWQ